MSKVFATADQLNVNCGQLNIWRDPFNQFQQVVTACVNVSHVCKKCQKRSDQSSTKVAGKHSQKSDFQQTKLPFSVFIVLRLPPDKMHLEEQHNRNIVYNK